MLGAETEAVLDDEESEEGDGEGEGEEGNDVLNLSQGITVASEWLTFFTGPPLTVVTQIEFEFGFVLAFLITFILFDISSLDLFEISFVASSTVLQISLMDDRSELTTVLEGKTVTGSIVTSPLLSPSISILGLRSLPLLRLSLLQSETSIFTSLVTLEDAF